MPAPSGSISVLSFGATGDGVTDDAPAIQAAIDAHPGGVIYVPVGDYRVGATIAVGTDNTTLIGEGPASVLRLMDDTTVSVIGIPVAYLDSSPPDFRVDGVTIERLCVDGNHNLLGGEGGDYFGIQVRQAQNLTIRKVLVRNLVSDGITISNGNMPTAGLVIEDCRITSRRSGIHVGFALDPIIRRNFIVDTPDQWYYPAYPWGSSAGHSIDSEVEGYDLFGPSPHTPFIRGLTVEDNLFVRTNATTTGDGIALQPAYGPVSDITIRRNVICGVPFCVETTGELGLYGESAGVHDIAIEDNWLCANAGLAVTGYALSLLGCDGAVVSGNIISDRGNGNFAGASGVVGCHDIAITGNTVRYSAYAGTAIAHVYGGNDLVAVTGNFYRTFDDVQVVSDGSTTNLTTSPNTSIGSDPWDLTPPACSLSVADGATLSSSTPITVAVTETGSAVDRVFFFVDGIPWGQSDASPHVFTFDPADHTDGDHTLSAMAVDGSANLGDEASVTITSAAPSATTAARILDEGGFLLLAESGDGILTEAEAADPDPDPDPDLTGNVLLFSRPGGRVLMYSRAGVTP